MNDPQISKEELAQKAVLLVRDRAKEFGLEAIEFDVRGSDVQFSEGMWNVPVHPSRQPERSFRYYELLAEVEENLADELGQGVMLLPSGVIGQIHG